MDALTEAVLLLLHEYVEVMGAKYASYHSIDDLKEDATLREVLREEREKLDGKLRKAKALIESLK